MGLMNKLPTNEKPREKAYLYGIEKLTNAELLAIILSIGSKNLDALELSQELINQCGSLKTISELSLDELIKFNGIKKVKAIKIKAAFELHNRLEKEKVNTITKINTIQEAALFLYHQITNYQQEHLLLLMLDDKNNLIKCKLLFIGTESMVFSTPKIIISNAVKEGAKKIIISHNHPSNIVLPSEEDKIQTTDLTLLSSVMGIEFLDHLILGENSFYSFTKNEISKYNF